MTDQREAAHVVDHQKTPLVYARGKIARFLVSDLLLFVLLAFGWCVGQEYAALGTVFSGNTRSFEVVQTAAEPGVDLIYRVASKEGTLLLSASCLVPLIVIASAAAGIMVLHFLEVLFSYYREDRAIRRILAPINEIALRADELSRLSFTEDKYQMIEDALENIHPEKAEAEGPLSFGDSDLVGVEAAMNNLLLRMRDTMRQQSRFVNDASHELRTPIAVIQGYANMLDRWGKTDEKILEEGISAIRNEADHMNYLVEQLLFLARGDSGRTALNRQPVRTDDLMREIYEESLMIDEKHRYRFKDSGEAAEVTIDPGLMKQAVRILIDNAAKYTRRRERRSFCPTARMRKAPHSCRCRIWDRDQRIRAPAYFRAVFPGGRGAGSAGTGLGLSIAKWIVDKHGGHFEVLTRKDLGTRIRIVL